MHPEDELTFGKIRTFEQEGKLIALKIFQISMQNLGVVKEVKGKK